MSGWTDERFTALKGLIAQGLSASQIGSELGVSRNAVIGKVHRGGLIFFNRQGAEPRRAEPRPRRGPTRRYPKAKAKAKAKAPPALAELEPEITAAAVTLAELTEAHCHWPIEGRGAQTRFCGATVVEGQPYCKRHYLMAHYRGPA